MTTPDIAGLCERLKTLWLELSDAHAEPPATARIMNALYQSGDTLERQAAEIKRLREALDLALDYLVEMEPGDSRAISNEFVAMLGVFLGVEPNTPGEDMAIIEKTLEARRARAALNQKGDER